MRPIRPLAKAILTVKFQSLMLKMFSMIKFVVLLWQAIKLKAFLQHLLYIMLT